MRYLRQSTATVIEVGPFIDDTDGKTLEEALTIASIDIQFMQPLDTAAVPPDRVANGAFTTDVSWTKGTGWDINSSTAGKAHHATGTGSDLEQTPATALVENVAYELVFVVSGISAGSVTPKIGGTSGTARSTSATFTEIIIAGSGALLEFTASSDFVGDLDDVVFKQVPIPITPAASGSSNDMVLTQADTGTYWLELTANQVGVVGRHKLTAFISGALIAWEEFMVLEEAIFDAFYITGSEAPSTKSQVDNIGAASGGSINIQMTEDNTTTDTIDNAAAVDKGSGLVGIPVTGHAFVAGSEVTIAGTTNYDGVEDIVSQTTNEVVITASFVSETFGGSETIVSSIKAVVFVGTVTSGTFASIEAQDGVTHGMDDVGNDIDIIYGCAVGGGRTATEVSIFANVNGNNDEIVVKVYDHVGADWESIGLLEGSEGSSFKALTLDLLLKHTGTGSDLGKTYIRFDTVTTTPVSLDVDKCLVRAVNIGQSVGYANGRIWINTNASPSNTDTEAFVDGVADNPVSTIAAAKTLSTSTGLPDFHLLNGSTIILTESTANESYFGDNWTLALGGQDVDGAYFQGAHVSGVGTSATEVHYEGCDVATMSVQKGHFDFCAFGGIVTQTLTGDYEYHNCYSNVAGTGGPTFAKTAGQTITAEWRGWSGSINITGLELNDILTISGELGTVDLGSPAAAAVVEIRGTYKEIVNTGSAALNLDGAIKGVDVATILVDTNELQADWADGGRLDLIIDAILADTGTDGVQVADKTGYAIGVGGIAAAAFAASAIDAAALATDAGQEIADRIIARNIEGGSDTGRTIGEAFARLRNRVRNNAGTLEVYDITDTSILWSGTITTASGDPISEVNPA